MKNGQIIYMLRLCTREHWYREEPTELFVRLPLMATGYPPVCFIALLNHLFLTFFFCLIMFFAFCRWLCFFSFFSNFFFFFATPSILFFLMLACFDYSLFFAILS